MAKINKTEAKPKKAKFRNRIEDIRPLGYIQKLKGSPKIKYHFYLAETVVRSVRRTNLKKKKIAQIFTQPSSSSTAPLCYRFGRRKKKKGASKQVDKYSGRNVRYNQARVNEANKRTPWVNNRRLDVGIRFGVVTTPGFNQPPSIRQV